jgi:hypothetical protein
MDHEFDDMMGDLGKLMAEESEKEIVQVSTMQGQIAALVALLRQKGVLTTEDVQKWEKDSDEMASLISATLKAGFLARSHEEAGEDELALSAQLDSLELAKELAFRLGAMDSQIREMDKVINDGRSHLEKMKRGADREN